MLPDVLATRKQARPRNDIPPPGAAGNSFILFLLLCLAYIARCLYNIQPMLLLAVQ
jgi:hypothetical protein